MKNASIGTYFSTPDFYRKALRLALPICLQQALNHGASFLDTMMVSHVGGVGAVTVATQVDNLLMLVGFGVNSCILIFASQFFGAGNQRNLKRCFGLQLLLNICLAAAFFLLAKLGAPWFLSFFSDDPQLLELAQQYISISAYSYFFTSLINGFTFMYRSVQTTKVPMLFGLGTNCLNALLNYLLIFGKLGLPAMGVRGAAVATVIATFCGLTGHVVYAFATRQPFLGTARESFRWPAAFLRPIFRRMLPMAGNELIFGLGDAMYLKAFGMLGTSMLEAYQVSYKIGMVPYTIADGMGSASGILLGEHLGRGETEEARSTVRCLLPLAAGLSVVVSAVMIVIARPVVSVFALPDSSVDIAVLMVRLFNIRIATRMFNAVLLSAVRAGGDTKFLLFMDSGLVWLVGIPAAYIGLLLLKVNSLPVLFLLVQSEQVIRMVIGLIRCRSGVWLHNLTVETGSQ